MPDELNLDLINMVQRGRMAHDGDTRPSQISGVYWIEAKAPEGTPGPTLRAGSWRIDSTLEAVDDLWAKIKAATEAGKLGYKSKVATASRDSSVTNRAVHVLTYDSADQADVDRVRATLDSLGISDEWTYHTD
jgi:hypothetical protein